ncbi:FAD:protein FMN transferase [Aerococcus viridans]|uniref:FAD:protein FMN transferase n=1 Tax=Aerococcus viridans TaxID=1377 RepID=UPI0037F6F466
MEEIVFEAVGTTISLAIVHDKAQVLLTEAKRRLLDYEERFSANDPDSLLMRVNAKAGLAPVQVDADLFKLIAIGKYYSLRSDVSLNIAIGPLIKLWQVGFEGANLPSEVAIQDRLALTHPADIILDDAKQTVYLAKQRMEIDLGAVAKGYFADLIKDYFLEQDVQSGMINLGGNVLLVGAHLENPGGFWRVGVQDPDQSRNHLRGIIQFQDGTVVTSGIYERHFEYQGKTYHHIFDSQTSYPVDNDLAGLTIVSKSSLVGEIYTSLYFNLTSQDLLAKLSATSGVEAVIITRDGDVVLTEGIKPFYTPVTEVESPYY